ncbi:MAG: ABC transporter permease subunit, partial [Verrucomicrobia bacterium]|nr:ABC transporter permease subunit [Verrucomicrobiota bacterium]
MLSNDCEKIPSPSSPSLFSPSSSPSLSSAHSSFPPTLTPPPKTNLLARVMEGARISLLVGLSGASISLVVGTTYGLISGYVGGTTDSLMMRFIEILYSIPRLIIIILATAAFDHRFKDWLNSHGHTLLVGYSKIIILVLALGLIEWLTMARIVRGQVLSLKNLQFVVAAR